MCICMYIHIYKCIGLTPNPMLCVYQAESLTREAKYRRTPTQNYE